MSDCQLLSVPCLPSELLSTDGLDQTTLTHLYNLLVPLG